MTTTNNNPWTATKMIALNLEVGMAWFDAQDNANVWRRISKKSSDGKEVLIENEDGSGFWFNKRTMVEAGY
jgi:hypothetical protein